MSLEFQELWQEGKEDRKTCNGNHGARRLAERFSLHFEEEYSLHRKWPFLELKPLSAQFLSSVDLIKPSRKETFSTVKLSGRMFSSEL